MIKFILGLDEICLQTHTVVIQTGSPLSSWKKVP